MLISEAIPTPTFANHESFHLRYGWLKKAYDQVRDDSQIFQRDDALIKLGVGKNMVRSIKFWATANKIIEPYGKKKPTPMRTTQMGDLIFDNNEGVDPYLEKPETSWLLHWLLLSPPCRIPVWWIILNEFTATNVNLGNMTESVTSRITNMAEWKTPSDKSVKKDIDVFIRTYTTRQDKLTMEEYLDCPFRQLNILKQKSKDEVRFVFGKKHGLSSLIVAFSCLDFIDRSNISSNSVSVDRLATEPGSVGSILKLTENDLADMLTEASDKCNTISLDNVNGAHHLTFDSSKTASMQILSEIYGKKIHAPKQMEALAQ